MRPEDILYWLRQAPFKSFRIHLVSGKTYDIRHPEMVKVSRSTLHLYSYRQGTTDLIEHMEMVGLVLVERIEPLEASTAA